MRALVRPSSAIPDLDVERVTGDLRDPAPLSRAVSGCGVVFHVAADYRLWSRHPAELYQSNVEGTRNMLSASRAVAGVERSPIPAPSAASVYLEKPSETRAGPSRSMR